MSDHDKSLDLETAKRMVEKIQKSRRENPGVPQIHKDAREAWLNGYFFGGGMAIEAIVEEVTPRPRARL